ncbi:MAG: hypothetical protein Ct9H300mP9_5930 [Candidatus Neomarinimicrobiota bacterium]|nr:MAG: hypothetical protein Ct9H300mP9_5930 [Candidatus Neomarinimicrobiota bacterium]
MGKIRIDRRDDMGYGGLMQGYLNMMEFPSVRRVGVIQGSNWADWGELSWQISRIISPGGTLLG